LPAAAFLNENTPEHHLPARSAGLLLITTPAFQATPPDRRGKEIGERRMENQLNIGK
jgi:hypothetical protein